MNSLEITSPQISKKEIHLLACQLAESLEDQNPLDVYAKMQKIKTLAESVMSQFKQKALDSIGETESGKYEQTVFGGKMQVIGGGKAFSGKGSYGHYDKWAETAAKLKEIEGEMKLVEKQGTTIIDNETGEEVPAALAQTRKPSLKYLF